MYLDCMVAVFFNVKIYEGGSGMIYTNLSASSQGKHGMFESSLLLATDVGNLFDARVQNAGGTDIDVDNGVAIAIGDYTGDGLQEVKATIAKTTDEIAVVGSPANVKAAMTTAQAQPYNYYVAAGTLAKAYKIVEPSVHNDIFAVALYQFTNSDTSDVKVGAYVVVDGTGKWTAQSSAPDASQYGFIGKVHSLAVGSYYTMVRIEVLQNKSVA